LIPVPPLPEQQKIAEILSTVDDAIQKSDKIIQKTQLLKNGLLHHLLTRGIGHGKFKQTEIGEIPEEWEVRTVSDLCEKPEYGYTQSATEKPIGPKFLRITDIQDGGVNWDEVPYCECPDSLIKKYLLQPGDILFARTGATTGKSYLISECPRSVFASYLIRVRTKEGIIPNFLFYFFNSSFYWKQVKQNMVGSTQGGMNASLLSRLRVQVPPLVEQQKIAEILSTVDKKIETETERKERLQKIKTGLMNDLLTGKRRVKVEA
jgi:type I restriction enzyme S subunit